MGKLTQEQNEVLAQIDAIIALLERSKMDGGLFDTVHVSFSPLNLLLSLLKRFGVGYGEIVEWLSEYIVQVTPVLELAIKGLMLAQLKSNVDCNLDPRIPIMYRERVGGVIDGANYEDNKKERGIRLNLNNIDYYGLLDFSPMTENSQYNYFGTKRWYTIDGVNESYYSYNDVKAACVRLNKDINSVVKHSEIDSVYELARAKDMNAFLWFILHKAKFFNAKELNDKTKCILKRTEIEANVNDENGIALGSVVKQSKYNVFGLCIKQEGVKTITNDTNNDATEHVRLTEVTENDIAEKMVDDILSYSSYNYTIVPTTNIWCGANWYVDRTKYLTDMVGKGNNHNEDNGENEFALFRLSTVNVNNSRDKEILFTIKPAPTIIKPEIVKVETYDKVEGKERLTVSLTGEAPWAFHRLTFDADGKRKLMGKYSISTNRNMKVGTSDIDGYFKYEILDPQNPSQKIEDVYLYVSNSIGDYFLKSVNPNADIRSALFECYPHSTVYEFNYDFIMGMRFFDPTVLTAQLIEALCNISIGGTFKRKRVDYQMRISEIVKSMLESQGAETTDCFYTFSNQQYDLMQQESELKRASLKPFNDSRVRAVEVQDTDVFGILNEYDANATLEENITVINRAFTQVTARISDEVLPEDKFSFEFNFIQQAIEMMTSIFVESLLSPKVLMVLLVHKKMMGDDVDKKWSIETILEEFQNIIFGLIGEMVDMLLQHLLDLVLRKMMELMQGVIKLLALEQIEYYTRLMRQILEACSFSSSNRNLKTMLDKVDYADIDPIEPKSEQC